MTQKIARLISYIFHPVFIPALLLLVIYGFAPTPFYFSLFSLKSFLALCGIVLLYTAIFPGAFIYWLFKRKVISDVELPEQTERPKVYLITSGFYIALTYFLYSKGGMLRPTSFLIGIMSVSIIGLGVFTLKEKISAHATAMGGFVGILLMVLLKYGEAHIEYPLFGVIIISGIVLSSRLALQVHSLKQVSLGFIWGMCVGLLGIFFL